MSVNTKIISLLLLFLLALPLFTGQLNQGSVLGVNEGSVSTISDSNSDGQIGGGVIDNKSTTNSSKGVTGLAVLDKQAKTSVLAKDFRLASEIKVETENKTTELIVSKVDQSLADGTVLIVDENTFKNLGGDPKTQERLEVSVLYAK